MCVCVCVNNTILAVLNHPFPYKIAASNNCCQITLIIPMKTDSDYNNDLKVIKPIAIGKGYTSSVVDK